MPVSPLRLCCVFQVELAAGLYDRGLIITDVPLEPLSDSDSDKNDSHGENKKDAAKKKNEKKRSGKQK